MRHTPTYRRMPEVMCLNKFVSKKIPKNRNLYHARRVINGVVTHPVSGVVSCAEKKGMLSYHEDLAGNWWEPGGEIRHFKVNKSLISEYVYVPDVVEHLIETKVLSKFSDLYETIMMRVREENEYIVPYVNGLLIPTQKVYKRRKLNG